MARLNDETWRRLTEDPDRWHKCPCGSGIMITGDKCSQCDPRGGIRANNAKCVHGRSLADECAKCAKGLGPDDEPVEDAREEWQEDPNAWKATDG